MKCENCGKYEASYHYTTNINGNVTEKHLCPECARKLGYDSNWYTGTDDIFGDMFDRFFGTRRRSFEPLGAFALPMATVLMPQIEIGLGDGGTYSTEVRQENAADPEMKKLREINMLKNQMKMAAEEENFEKAAEIRDKLRKLETENNSGAE